MFYQESLHNVGFYLVDRLLTTGDRHWQMLTAFKFFFPAIHFPFCGKMWDVYFCAGAYKGGVTVVINRSIFMDCLFCMGVYYPDFMVAPDFATSITISWCNYSYNTTYAC